MNARHVACHYSPSPSLLTNLKNGCSLLLQTETTPTTTPTTREPSLHAESQRDGSRRTLCGTIYWSKGLKRTSRTSYDHSHLHTTRAGLGGGHMKLCIQILNNKPVG